MRSEAPASLGICTRRIAVVPRDGTSLFSSEIIINQGISDWINNIRIKLAHAIEKEYNDGFFVVTKKARLNREYYASVIGVAPIHLKFCNDIFFAYEAIFEGAGRILDLMIPEMRKWLEAEYQAGTLQTRDGKLYRKKFEEAFGLKGGGYQTRSPAVCKLLKEFDVRIRAECYQSSEVECLIKKLKSILDSKECPLNKDRLLVNRAQIARNLGMRLIPFAQVGL